jgi:hypothetical protein
LENEIKEIENEISRFRSNMYGVQNIIDYLDNIKKDLKHRNMIDESKIHELKKIQSELEELNSEMSSMMVNQLKEYREATEKVTNIDKFIKKEKLLPESEVAILFNDVIRKIDYMQSNYELTNNNYESILNQISKIKENGQKNLEYSYNIDENIKEQKLIINVIKKDIFKLNNQIENNSKIRNEQIKLIIVFVGISIIIQLFFN